MAKLFARCVSVYPKSTANVWWVFEILNFVVLSSRLKRLGETLIVNELLLTGKIRAHHLPGFMHLIYFNPSIGPTRQLCRSLPELMEAPLRT